MLQIEKINNFNEYQKYLKEEIVREEALKNKLSVMKMLFSFTELSEIRSTKTRLNEVKNNLLNHKEFIDRNTTFSINDFLTFIIPFLKRTEQKAIVKPVFFHDYRKEAKAKNYKSKFIKRMLLDMEEEYYLITGKREAKKVKKLFREHTLYEALEELNLQKYILIPTEDDCIHLAQGIELKKEFRGFPALQYVFERAIELSFNSEQTQREKLDIILEEATQNRELILKRKKC